jgi:chitin disaccharide deacetylase
VKRVVILNADDFGYDPAVTKGIEKSMREGLVSSTTMMVNTPFSQDAASRSQGLAIGLHLNLVRFAAVSRQNFEFEESAVAQLTPEFVAKEAEAQLERLLKLTGQRATHLDVHKHAHQHDSVLEGIIICAQKNKMKVRSINAHMREQFRARGIATNDAFLGDAGHLPFWTLETFEEQLGRIPQNGVTELMCHTGYAPSHLKSGYSAQREIELATLTSPEAKELLNQRVLSFGNWNDV